LNNNSNYNLYYLFIVIFFFIVILFLSTGPGDTLPDTGTLGTLAVPSTIFLN
jgi:hypothetical protein